MIFAIISATIFPIAPTWHTKRAEKKHLCNIQMDITFQRVLFALPNEYYSRCHFLTLASALEYYSHFLVGAHLRGATHARDIGGALASSATRTRKKSQVRMSNYRAESPATLSLG